MVSIANPFFPVFYFFLNDELYFDLNIFIIIFILIEK